MKELEKRFIEMYNKIGRVQGMDNLLTSIFALLILEPDDIAMDDLAHKTGYSLASISNKIKLME